MKLNREETPQYATSRVFSLFAPGNEVVPALTGTSIQAYYGIDLSQAAIALAFDNLGAIACSKTLIEGDFTALVPDLISTQQDCFDVILALFSLHHFHLKQKDDLIGQLRQLLNPEGVLLLIDLVRQEAEDRTAYTERYLKSVRHDWTALTSQKVASIETHITSSDFPETQKMLKQLALNQVVLQKLVEDRKLLERELIMQPLQRFG